MDTTFTLPDFSCQLLASLSNVESVDLQEILANDYHVAAVSDRFVWGAPIDTNAPDVRFGLKPQNDAEAFEREWHKPLQQDPATLTIAECVANYSQPFNSDYSNLALVMDIHNSSSSLLGAWTYWFNGVALQAEWPCAISGTTDGSRCNLAELVTSNATYWNPFPDGLNGQHLLDRRGLPNNVAVNYCLAQKTNRTCHIGITPVIVLDCTGSQPVKSDMFL